MIFANSLNLFLDFPDLSLPAKIPKEPRFIKLQYGYHPARLNYKTSFNINYKIFFSIAAFLV